jgi:hypothetical protein
LKEKSSEDTRIVLKSRSADAWHREEASSPPALTRLNGTIPVPLMECILIACSDNAIRIFVNVGVGLLLVLAEDINAEV